LEADMETATAVAMIAVGAAMAAIWTRDIVAGAHVDLSAGVLSARDADSGSLFWPHWLAEYGTAAGLIAAGAGLLGGTGWADELGLLAVGSLWYTSVNSLGWALAERERRPYAAPMVAGLVVATGAAVVLIAG
jgi:hypothetical protein